MNIAAMQTLDLSGESKKSDGRLKSLLWPSVDNAWDVDYLGQQGFWICLIIGALNLAFLFFMALEVTNPSDVPERFSLFFKADGTRIPCHVIWRQDERMGVAFD